MRMLNDNVMVLVEAVSNMRGSLYVPDTAQEGQILYGKVVGVGPGKLNDAGTRNAPLVKTGETVWFPKFSASKIERDNKTYYVMAEQFVLGVE